MSDITKRLVELLNSKSRTLTLKNPRAGRTALRRTFAYPPMCRPCLMHNHTSCEQPGSCSCPECRHAEGRA